MNRATLEAAGVVEAAIARRVMVTPDGCIVPVSNRDRLPTVDGDGYSRLAFGVLAHRAVVEAVKGSPIADGLEVDHRCRRRACVRPSHLQLVTRAEHQALTNARRAIAR